MNNIPSSTPGFVLTSLSLRRQEEQRVTQNPGLHTASKQQSSIAKFDYCLPPEEFIIAETGTPPHMA